MNIGAHCLFTSKKMLKNNYFGLFLVYENQKFQKFQKNVEKVIKSLKCEDFAKKRS